MGLGSSPHGLEAHSPWSSSFEHAPQVEERPGSPEEDVISLNLEEKHRPGIHLQVFPYLTWNR